MPGRASAPWWRTLLLLLGGVSLSTCGSDSPTGSEPRGLVTLDASALLALADSFNLRFDQFTVRVRAPGSSTAIVSQTFTGASIAARPLTFLMQVPLAGESEDIAADVEAWRGGTGYFAVSDSGALRSGGTISMTPQAAAYTGPGTDADSVHFVLDTTIWSGDSVQLSAQVLKGGILETGALVAFTSLDSTQVRIHRAPGQALSRAWAVGVGAGAGPSTIVARIPGRIQPSAAGQLGLMAGVARLEKVSGDNIYLYSNQLSSPIVIRATTADSQPFGQGVRIQFSVTGATGSALSVTDTVTDASGLARTTLHGGLLAGYFTVLARAVHNGSPIGDSAVSFTGGIGYARPTHYISLTPDTQTTVVNTDVPVAPAMKVTDSSDKPIAGLPVTFTLCSECSGSYSPESIRTDTLGIARADHWQIGPVAGTPYYLFESVGGGGGVMFTAIGTHAPAASIEIIGGNNQNQPVGVPLPVPLSGRVIDQFGNPVPGMTISWSTPDGGSFSTVTTVSDSLGEIQTSWTLGPSAFAQSAHAGAAALPDAVYHGFALTGVAPIAVSYLGVPGVGAGLTAVVGATLSQPAPSGGVTIHLATDAPQTATVPNPDRLVAEGETTAMFTISGVDLGSTVMHAFAPGFAQGTLTILVEDRHVAFASPVYPLPVGYGISYTFFLPNPAPAGGVTFTLTSSNPDLISADVPTVTVPEGENYAQALFTRHLPGPVQVTVSNPAYFAGVGTLVDP
ncbi:MAG TPA: hypothetical protein VJN95_02010 [Gemmatimonadales bacterium]|nr:hypothetical protein [Gemmatimonadales bacterium]